LGWVIAALALERLLYHLAYLRDVPFAVATISDGRIYERAAADLIANPPLGAAPFYLQGLYAAQLAVPIAIGGFAFALLVQLALASLAWWVFHRALRSLLGRRTAAWGIALALAHPPLAFYENKFLSASLTIVCSIAVVAALAWVARRATRGPILVAGLAAAACVLARPNLLLAAPAIAIACMWLRPAGTRTVVLAVFALGFALGLAPMAARNAVVTGTPTVFPAHGGGTSFYIGNNANARGVWNPAGLFSGDVTREAEELGEASDDAQRVAAMGDELYRRAWQEIADDPGRWLWLLCRKAWLMIGNDELAQDYDVYGEHEMIPWANRFGIPFGVLAALAVIGGAAWWRRPGERVHLVWILGLAAATVLGNLIFFTSAQHRLPLAIPMCVLGAVGAGHLATLVGDRAAVRRDRVILGVAILVLAQSFWPRSRQREPSAVHYYNLALAFDHVGEPRAAYTAIERALERAPDQPLMLLHRATLRRRFADFPGARADLDRIAASPDLPGWARVQLAEEEQAITTGLAQPPR
jgi:hypothetical protein